jgi:hypothetical protein
MTKMPRCGAKSGRAEARPPGGTEAQLRNDFASERASLLKSAAVGDRRYNWQIRHSSSRLVAMDLQTPPDSFNSVV